MRTHEDKIWAPGESQFPSQCLLFPSLRRIPYAPGVHILPIVTRVATLESGNSNKFVRRSRNTLEVFRSCVIGRTV